MSPIGIVPSRSWRAITSQLDHPLYSTEVLISPPDGGLRTDSVALLNQIRSFDKQRLVRRLGTLNRKTMERVDNAILISMGLINI
jgi:mRNA interferase MazF